MNSSGPGLERKAVTEFMLGLLRGHVAELSLAAVLTALEGATALLTPWFAAELTRRLLAGALPDWLLPAWVAVLAVQAVSGYLNARIVGTTAARISCELGVRVHAHALVVPIGWHESRSRGDALTLLGNDVTRLCSVLAATLPPLLPALFILLAALLLMARINLAAALVVALAVPLLLLLVRFALRHVAGLSEVAARQDARKFAMAEQNLSAIEVLKAFTAEPREARRYSEQSAVVRDTEIEQLKPVSVLAPALRLLTAATMLAFVGVAVAGGFSATMGPAELVALLAFGFVLAQPLSQLAGAYGQVRSAHGCATRLISFLATPAESSAADSPAPSTAPTIRFDSVAFSYPERAILFDSLDFEVRSGEVVAITGANGAGKSTIAKLILRFVDPRSGSVSLDGIDLRGIELAQLRQSIGFVPQRVELVAGSVAENIAYGWPEAGSEEIRAAARAARADAFIAALPMGYETSVGADGIRLSGGQRQRVCLARALLKNPRLLLFDEATAMFDPEGEESLLEDFRELARGRTVVVITHRPAVLALCDRVLEVRAGQVRLAQRERPATS